MDFGLRTGDTEAGLLSPATLDWRLPNDDLSWPHGWCPFTQPEGRPRGNGTGSLAGTGAGDKRALRRDSSVRVVHHNKEGELKRAGPLDLWLDPKTLVLDGQVSP